MNSKRVMTQFVRNWLRAFVDSRRILSAVNLPRYLAHWRRYHQLAGPDAIRWQDSYPCLTDWTPATPFDAHYFYQAGWVARKLTESKPAWHVDIGSSVMMIGVMSAIVPTVFVDYRPFGAQMAGLVTTAGDLLALPFIDEGVYSLSCLHVIEHVGLGRYGEPINPQGSIKAAQELVRVLAVGGRLFVSTPIGRERIAFNAHRVFAPETVLTMFDDLQLVDYAMVDDQGTFRPGIHPAQVQVSNCEYACGMFHFVKK
jgi:SAM-dependent methyltransferase